MLTLIRQVPDLQGVLHPLRRRRRLGLATRSPPEL